MILLTVAGAAPPEARLTVAVFGIGLVGSAVVEALSGLPQPESAVLPLTWGAGAQTEQELARIEETIAVTCRRHDASLRFVWSAGRAGFDATAEETAPELAVFREVLAVAERQAERFPDRSPSFHLVSSAGGLFEGQQLVGAASIPRPRRPYGSLKLAQENLLRASLIPARRIYRLSSVYGYVRRGQRLGLVTTLLVQGVQQRVSFLTGRMSTLRDFVFAGDVASYITRCLLADGGQPGERIALVACGRAASLFEVRRVVEAQLARKIFVVYSLDPANQADITFSPDAAPAGWDACDLRTGVARVYRDALASGALFDAGLPSRL